MRTHIIRTVGLAAALVALAGSAQAQGRGNGKGKAHGQERPANGAVIDRRSDGDVYIPRTTTGRKIPPGLAKKPGQMPPGQYKKIYGTNEGASVLSDILRRRGYAVDRIVPTGESQYVYYRANDGSVRRALVSPGTDRLHFSSVPAQILREVLARLY